jgi:hypothetical protein
MLLTGSKFTPDDAKVIHEERLLCIQNGIYFVNFLATDLDECFVHAKTIYETERAQLDGREPELAKHRWLQDFILSTSTGGHAPYMGEISYFQLPNEDHPPSEQ